MNTGNKYYNNYDQNTNQRFPSHRHSIRERNDWEKIKRIVPHLCYTKEEVDLLIKGAVDEARRIDEESMKKHNRDATVISMILGFTTLALFVDGLLRMLGIIPPFMHLDVNILDKIETDIIDKIKQVPIQKLFKR